MGKKRLLVGVAVLVALAAMGGCGWFGGPPQHRVFVQHEAGDSHVAVLSIAPWEDYVQRLQPQFEISGKTALEQVLPLSARLEEKVVAGLSAQITPPALPEVTKSGGITKKISEEGKVSTEDKSEYTQKPAAQYTPSNQLAGKEAANLKAPEGALNVDPMLRHLAATALYQEVQVLNSYLHNATIGQDYQPYLVRLQVSLMPKARNEPYDAYTMLTFFQIPVSPEQPVMERAPRVIPLLISDNLEMALAARSHEFLLKLSASLSLATQGAAGGDIGAVYDKIQSSISQEFNSLFTVARISENTLRIRMGAYRLGDKAYAMVPRTHHLNLLLLVPKPNKDIRPGKMAVLARTDFVNAVTGKELDRRSEKQAKDFARLQAHTILNDEEKDKLTPEVLEELMSLANSNDQKTFHEVAKNKLGLPRKKHYTLWLDLLMVRCGAKYDVTTFSLPCRRTNITVWLQEQSSPPGANVRGDVLVATVSNEILEENPACFVDLGICPRGPRTVKDVLLEVLSSGRSYFLPAISRGEQTVALAKGGNLKFIFPSLKGLGLEGNNIDKITLVFRTSKNKDKPECDQDEHYSCYLVPEKPEKPSVKLDSSVSTIMSAPDNTGKLPIDVKIRDQKPRAKPTSSKKTKKETSGCAAPGGGDSASTDQKPQAYVLAVKGASLTGFECPDGAKAQRLGSGKIALTESGAINLALANLEPGTEVTVSPLLGDKPAGDPLTVKVGYIPK
ncbi:MAG: hypothetical protein HY794_05170 [Desulfarculus sp.]|nr:hypothetical protein [Desulfarculus sp.]